MAGPPLVGAAVELGTVARVRARRLAPPARAVRLAGAGSSLLDRGDPHRRLRALPRFRSDAVALEAPPAQDPSVVEPARRLRHAAQDRGQCLISPPSRT